MERLWSVMDEQVPPAPAKFLESRPLILLLSIIALVAGIVLRLALESVLGDRVIFLFFVPSLLIAAIGGLMPALTVTLLGTVAGSVILSRYGVIAGNLVDAAVFAGLGIFIGAGGERLRRLQLRAGELTERVMERQAYMQSVLEAAPDAMIVVDDENIVQSFSPAAQRMFGWTTREIVGEEVAALFAPNADTAGRFGTASVSRLHTARRKDGTQFPVQITVGQLSWIGHTYSTLFVHDRTEETATRQRLETVQSELLHGTRLAAMGEMAAGVAHELNQPLTAANNFITTAQTLMEQGSVQSQKASGALGKALEQVSRAARIVKQLRGFTAKGQSERELVNLADMLSDVTGIALVGSAARGIQAQVSCDPSVEPVLADKAQIQQVVFNLVRNALEAMRESDRRILQLSAAPASPGRVRISVCDTGHGIRAEVRERLFEPFMSTKGEGGMGLGLSICRRIVESHGGEIWAETNPDGGSIFHVTLPAPGADESIR